MGTCGMPGELTGNGDQLGCWCICSIGAQVARKECWARVNELPFGWER
jgi:hypothetical protein